VTLYLIRHAHAGQSNHDDPNDHLRPLSRKGQVQAARLERACILLGLRFNRLFSSPYTRAAETAAPLAKHVRGGRLEPLADLTGDDHARLLEVLQHTLKAGDATVGLVGHEPHLSGLTSYLLCGRSAVVRIRFRKGMLVRLDGPLKPGQLELHSALTPTLLKQLTAP
jgi:phosphohistidine phosphatase